MPQATINLEEQVSVNLPNAGNTFAVIAVCSKGAWDQNYTFEANTSPSAVQSSVGNGVGCEAAGTLLRYGKRTVVLFPVEPSVAGAVSSVTNTRPSDELAILTNILAEGIAADGDVLIDGPYDSLTVCIKITKSGSNGTAKMAVAYDHQIRGGRLLGTFSGDMTVPDTMPAELIGTVDLTGLTYGGGGDLDGETLIIDSDTTTPVTVTFAAPADEDDVVDQINAQNGGGTKFLADLVGANKLRLRSITEGSGGQIKVTTGTTNETLGFTDNQEEPGRDAILDLTDIGVRLTAQAGDFVVNDYYTFTTTAPKIAPAAVTAAMTRVKASIAGGATIGAVWIAQEDADAIDARAMLDAVSSELETARGEKFYLWGLYGLPRGASDADVLTYCGTFVDPYMGVAAGDMRAKGGALSGARFHRSPSWVAAWKAARFRMSSDLGNHSDIKLNSAFGVTEIGRDERTATTKLATFRAGQTQNGGGFLVLETPANAAGEAYFYQGRSMAGAGSVLGDLDSSRVLLASARALQVPLDLQINSDPPVRPDGSLVDAGAIRSQLEGPVRTLLFEDPEAPNGHASALEVSEPSYIPATHTMTVDFVIQRNAKIKAVLSNVGIVEVIEQPEEV